MNLVPDKEEIRDVPSRPMGCNHTNAETSPGLFATNSEPVSGSKKGERLVF